MIDFDVCLPNLAIRPYVFAIAGNCRIIGGGIYQGCGAFAYYDSFFYYKIMDCYCVAFLYCVRYRIIVTNVASAGPLYVIFGSLRLMTITSYCINGCFFMIAITIFYRCVLEYVDYGAGPLVAYGVYEAYCRVYVTNDEGTRCDCGR